MDTYEKHFSNQKSSFVWIDLNFAFGGVHNTYL